MEPDFMKNQIKRTPTNYADSSQPHSYRTRLMLDTVRRCVQIVSNKGTTDKEISVQTGLFSPRCLYVRTYVNQGCQLWPFGKRIPYRIGVVNSLTV